MRIEQREATREKIVSAALLAISEAGFDGVSTRAIAQRAGVSQGLLSYHFKSKEALWRAAADYLFAMVKDSLKAVLFSLASIDPRELRRELIRQMVYLSAKHPEIMRFMFEHGKEDNERSRWLIDTHVRPMYLHIADLMVDIPEADMPHVFYAVVGASGAMFCVPNECKRATGVDPRSKSTIKRHADYLANLMVPE